MDGVCGKRLDGGGGGGGAEKSPLPRRTADAGLLPDPGGAGGIKAWPPVGGGPVDPPLLGADGGNAVTVASGINGCLG